MAAINRLLFAFLFVALAACSTDPEDEPSTRGAEYFTGKQVYDVLHLLQCDTLALETCDFDKAYTGSGMLKWIVRDYSEGGNEDIMGSEEVGAINNGKINLELPVPKEEYLYGDTGGQWLTELVLYNGANQPIGRLFLMDKNIIINKDGTIAYYVYSSEERKHESSRDILPPHSSGNVRLIDDVDFQIGWNLVYDNDKYDYIIDGESWYINTQTTDAGILNGAELRWYLVPIGLN
jgi:hypothetical protein